MFECFCGQRPAPSALVDSYCKSSWDPKKVPGKVPAVKKGQKGGGSAKQTQFKKKGPSWQFHMFHCINYTSVCVTICKSSADSYFEDDLLLFISKNIRAAEN